MPIIRNPILPGFNPDPSICRVDEDFYIATSTFEWFPGVQIHHSRDLVNWHLLTHALGEKRLLDLQGVPSSGGIWAPALSWHDDLFYLCYTVVHQHEAATKDTPNFLITSASIHGPWSVPVYINSSGFDPSLFHDDDGRKYWLNMIWDHRPKHHPFYGIMKQEINPVSFEPIGQPKLIFKGTEIGLTEGPHIYKKDGLYYLLTAEGGTEYDHAVTLARSSHINGPYEVHPHNPVLTSKGDETLRLQKAGHASLVETQGGEWYLPHLCGRPLPETRRCNLGRETAIQKMEWRDDGWLYVAGGGNSPKEDVESPALKPHPWPKLPSRLPFTSPHFATPRGPSSTIVASEKKLTLYGSESLESCFPKSLLARRLTHHNLTATTKLSCKPSSFQQMAGITAYYNNRLFHHLYLSHDETIGNCLHIHTCDDGASKFPLGTSPVPVNCEELFLRIAFKESALQFSWSTDGERFSLIGPPLDASILSDDYGKHLDFTGTFVGVTSVDMSGMKNPAEFYFLEFLT
ncbi:glycoside hydrolase family 43 protein [Pirellulales bacterium]|nr:glycoside hydrolase family 43 protein [Pirellulales bacterium]